MNDLAKQLIYDLRFDAYTREHFNIRSYLGNATCGSVGCIAGTAFYRAFPELQGKFKQGEQDKFLKVVPGFSAQTGAKILGLPTEAVAKQLFLPWAEWEEPLLSGFATFIYDLSDNERPNLDTVEKMVAWARHRPDNAWHPTHCANALENVLERERMYVDWADAWEPA